MDYFRAMLNRSIPNIEMHIYGNGGHAGGLRDRNDTPFGTWQNRFIDWYRDLGFLEESGVVTKAAQDSEAFVNRPARGNRRGGGGRGEGRGGRGFRGQRGEPGEAPAQGGNQ
jgi:hypothetical protein